MLFFDCRFDSFVVSTWLFFYYAIKFFCCIVKMSFIQDARTCDGTSKIFRLSTFFGKSSLKALFRKGSSITVTTEFLNLFGLNSPPRAA